MKFAKSFLTGTGALVLAGLVLSLLAPKAAHAIAATMVLVENTAASPVPNLDTERNARVPYESAGSEFCEGTCSGGSTAVPAGYRLVVQSVSLGASSLQSAFAGQTIAYLTDASGQVNAPLLPAVVVGAGDGVLITNQAVTAYYDAGDQPLIQFHGLPQGITGEGQITVVGYLESCSVATCAPIQR